jgi:hypothetical protein
MRTILLLGPLGLLLLSACAAPVPRDQGVGFADYGTYQAQREAQLTGQPMGGFSAAPMTSPYGMASPYGMVAPVNSATPPGGIPSTALAAAGIGRAGVATAPMGAPLPGISGNALPGVRNPSLPGVSQPGGMVAVASSGVAGDVNMMRSSGLEASPSNAAPALVGAMPSIRNTGISDEQDFAAVSSRESIESDAARRAAQAAQYQVMQPQALPDAPASTGPNIVEYALSAPNSRGQQWYSRFAFAREGRQLRNCAEYQSPDEAQRDFLARGGPERDPRGLDPDGDGFACAWDPAPFRAAVGRG